MIVYAASMQAQNTEEEFLKNYESRIKLERIDDVYIPKDLKDAIKELDRLTDDKVASKLTGSPEDTIASKLHFSLGRWMLLHWGLEEGSRLSANLKAQGLSFPDDMMDFLIRCWYRHLRKLPIEEDKLLKQYIDKRRADYLRKLNTIDTISIHQKQKQQK
jgi:hypothetical protein